MYRSVPSREKISKTQRLRGEEAKGGYKCCRARRQSVQEREDKGGHPDLVQELALYLYSD